MKITYSTTVELPTVTIIFKKEGYTHLHYKNKILSLADNKKIFETVRKNTPWEKCPFLITGEENAEHDKESKAFNVSDLVTKHMSAQAFVVKSASQKIAYNLYIKFFRPKTPFKVFTIESEATEWLKPFIGDNKFTENND